MKDKEIGEHFDILKELIYEMLMFGRIFRQFHKKNKYYQKYFDLAPTFFTLIYKTIWTSLILSITKVYCEGPNYQNPYQNY